MGWLYVPGWEGSNWDSGSSSEMRTAAYVSSSDDLPQSTSFAGQCRPASSIEPPSGTTSTHSTVSSGVDAWISSLRGFRASHTRVLRGAVEFRMIFGLRHLQSSRTHAQALSLWRTFQAHRGKRSEPTWNRSGTGFHRPFASKPPTWVRHTDARVSSYLPTPTTRANALSPSMGKWPAHRNLAATFSSLGLDHQHLRSWNAWLMGYPPGWLTGSSERASYQSWQRQHSALLHDVMG